MKDPYIKPQLKPTFAWNNIETVLLDMDGTLLDKYFDDYFWEQAVPEKYGDLNQMPVDAAREELFGKYRRVQSTLLWTDLDYWSEQLGLDIPAIKQELSHLISVHPHVVDFLVFLRKNGKQIYLVTAANHKDLEIKIEKTGIDPFFDQLICAEEVGTAKEDVQFWHMLERMLGFTRTRTLLADDTTSVLDAAQQFGIEELVHIAKPSSRKPLQYSHRFTSVASFDELMF